MRDWTDCKHFWQLMGSPRHRWVDGHAAARCKHCRSWTVVDMDGLGPCFHSVGQRQHDYVAEENIPLEKEEDDPAKHPEDCQCYLCYDPEGGDA